MAMPAVKLESHMLPEERITRLETNVEHIKADIAEMKTDIREIRHDYASLRAEMHKGFSEMKDAIASAKVWALLLYIGMGTALLGTMAGGFVWLLKELRP